MTKTINLREQNPLISELLSLMRQGHEVVLTEGEVPDARVLPVEQAQERVLGLHPGAIWTSEDFDAPLPDEFWTGHS